MTFVGFVGGSQRTPIASVSERGKCSQGCSDIDDTVVNDPFEVKVDIGIIDHNVISVLLRRIGLSQKAKMVVEMVV